MSEIKAKLRKLRIIQALLIGIIVAHASLFEVFFSEAHSRWSLWHSLTAGLGMVCALEGFHFRRRYLAPAAAALARDPRNPKAVQRWAGWHSICLLMATAVGAYGLWVRMFLRGSLLQALLFYVVGLFLLLLWTPKAPTAFD